MKEICVPLGRINTVHCSDANYSNCTGCKKPIPPAEINAY